MPTSLSVTGTYPGIGQTLLPDAVEVLRTTRCAMRRVRTICTHHFPISGSRCFMCWIYCFGSRDSMRASTISTSMFSISRFWPLLAIWRQPVAKLPRQRRQDKGAPYSTDCTMRAGIHSCFRIIAITGPRSNLNSGGGLPLRARASLAIWMPTPKCCA